MLRTVAEISIRKRALIPVFVLAFTRARPRLQAQSSKHCSILRRLLHHRNGAAGLLNLLFRARVNRCAETLAPSSLLLQHDDVMLGLLNNAAVVITWRDFIIRGKPFQRSDSLRSTA
jgi:hypothetical protein